MIFEFQSKNKKILFITFITLLISGTCYLIWLNFISQPKPIFCTQEAKFCPNGSYIGRTGPNCEFAECPLENNQILSNFGNNQVEKAITDYLLIQKHFSWKTGNNSYNFCAIENLNPENDLFPLYVWVYCGEYVVQDDKLETLSGSSGPVKINYPNELSFYDLSRFSYEAPRDGSYYSEDIKKIFPKNIQQRISNFNMENIIKRIETIVITNNLSWESIKQAINNCEVEEVWQMHNRDVTAKLKDGEKLTAVEPQLDDVIIMAESVEQKCGKILMGTE